MPKEPRRRHTTHTTGRARALRHDAPIPERILWSLLRGRKLGDLKFRRQQAVGPFVVDFICEKKRLIVELDGLSHVGRANADGARTIYLQSRGYRVVRFTNDELLGSTEAVAEAIARTAGLDW